MKTYNKLVRDLIPHIIEESGKSCDWRYCTTVSEYEDFLRKKMNEEMEEYFEDPCPGEAADIYEVMRAIFHLHEIDTEFVETVAETKREERGGFENMVILKEVHERDKE
jgi:predicted house-cleaning noncanonical NTP pyrophosphatase (MazG superfamily)